MNQTTTPPAGLSTTDLARAVGLQPDSIRVHLCRAGSYYGIKPRRLPNGRLLWPADSVARLLALGTTTDARPGGFRKARKQGAA
jgi:hypothetical protein